MTDKLQIGLAGCGHWGQYILRDLLSLGCNVTVVARSEESRARAQKTGASHLVTDVMEIPEIDGLVIATPTTTHHELFEQVVDRNIPIFTEKPLTANVAQAEDMVQRAGDRIFVNPGRLGVRGIRDPFGAKGLRNFDAYTRIQDPLLRRIPTQLFFHPDVHGQPFFKLIFSFETLEQLGTLFFIIAF